MVEEKQVREQAVSGACVTTQSDIWHLPHTGEVPVSFFGWVSGKAVEDHGNLERLVRPNA